jgi:hypothetical protein
MVRLGIMRIFQLISVLMILAISLFSWASGGTYLASECEQILVGQTIVWSTARRSGVKDLDRLKFVSEKIHEMNETVFLKTQRLPIFQVQTYSKAPRDYAREVFAQSIGKILSDNLGYWQAEAERNSWLGFFTIKPLLDREKTLLQMIALSAGDAGRIEDLQKELVVTRRYINEVFGSLDVSRPKGWDRVSDFETFFVDLVEFVMHADKKAKADALLVFRNRADKLSSIRKNFADQHLKRKLKDKHFLIQSVLESAADVIDYAYKYPLLTTDEELARIFVQSHDSSSYLGLKSFWIWL